MNRNNQQREQEPVVKPQFGYAWPVREGIGEPDEVVRLNGKGEFLRVEDGTVSTAPTIVYDPHYWM